MNRSILLIILGISMLSISGCLQPQEKENETIIPNMTVSPTTAIPTTAIPTTSTPTIVETTLASPEPTVKELNPGTFYVVTRMIKPTYWGDSKYEIERMQVSITNQIENNFLIKAQILNDEQILEEKSFMLEHAGSSYSFSNEKRYFINNTNLTLRLSIQGYKPAEYEFTEVTSIS